MVAQHLVKSRDGPGGLDARRRRADRRSTNGSSAWRASCSSSRRRPWSWRPACGPTTSWPSSSSWPSPASPCSRSTTSSRRATLAPHGSSWRALAITLVAAARRVHRPRVEPVLLRLPADRGRGGPRGGGAGDAPPRGRSGDRLPGRGVHRRRTRHSRRRPSRAWPEPLRPAPARVGGLGRGARPAQLAPEAIRLSTVDSLTGLFNRAYFFAALEREIQRSARSGRGFCLLMMDLDGLKAVNDRFGHFNGDRALRTVGETVDPGSAGSTRPPATAATSSSSCFPRPSRPAVRAGREDPRGRR